MTNRDALGFIARSLSREPGADAGLEAQIRAGGVDWPRVVFLASAHYVVPSLYPALRRRGLAGLLPPDLLGYLKTVWTLNRERNDRIRAQLTELVQDLNLVGAVPLVLKGANVFLPNSWPGARDRVLGDLDIQVPEERVPEVLSAMRQRGYRAAPEQFAGSAVSVGHHLPPLIHPDHLTHVELHTQLGSGMLARLLPCDQVRGEAQCRWLGDARVLQPTPSWQLLHGLLHAGLQNRHYRRRSLELRHLNDWVQTCRLHERRVPWPVMQQRLTESGQGMLLSAYLLLAQTLFGQSLPKGIQIETQARRVARETLTAIDNDWMARRFRASAWLLGLPQRLRALPPKLVTPSWYAYRLRKRRTSLGQRHAFLRSI
jgi:hypothetical protein